jgi:hypothetical protein
MTRYNPMFMSQVTVRPSSCWHCFFARWLADVWHVGQLHRQMAILIEIWWYRLNNNVQTSPMTNHLNHDTHPIGCIWYTDCRWWCSYDTQIKVDTADHGTVNATGIEGTAHFQSKKWSSKTIIQVCNGRHCTQTARGFKTHNKRLHADLVWKNNFQELANIQNHPESRLQN